MQGSQPMTPEQMDNLKVENKAGELQQQEAQRQNPNVVMNQSMTDILRAQMVPKPKLQPQPTMRVMSSNGQLFGVPTAKKGTKLKSNIETFDPYGSKKTQGLNPKKVIMGQGSGAVQSNEKMYTGRAHATNYGGA